MIFESYEIKGTIKLERQHGMDMYRVVVTVDGNVKIKSTFFSIEMARTVLYKAINELKALEETAA